MKVPMDLSALGYDVVAPECRHALFERDSSVLGGHDYDGVLDWLKSAK